MDAEWTRYAQEGLIVDLHLGRERYMLQLTLQRLGIEGRTPEETKLLQRTVKPGHVYLLPYDVIARGDGIDGKARQCLKRHSFKTMWGRWVHKSRYAAWRAENIEIRNEYMADMEAVLRDYDKHRQDAIAGYLGLLNKAWANLMMTVAGRQIEGISDRDTWLNLQLDSLLARIPLPEEIRKNHRYDWDVWTIPLQAQIEQDRINAGDLRLIAAEREMMLDVEASAKARAKAGVNGFLAEIQAQIQNQVCVVAEGALAAMQGNQGRLGRNSSVAIANLIQTVNDLVFWEDGSLEANMRRLQAILDTSSKKRDPQAVRSTLLALGAEARLALMELTPAATRQAAASAGDLDDLDDLAASARPTARTADDLDIDLGDTIPAMRTAGRQAVETAAL